MQRLSAPECFPASDTTPRRPAPPQVGSREATGSTRRSRPSTGPQGNSARNQIRPCGERIEILGVEVDALDEASLLARVRAAIGTRTRLRLCALNTAKLVRMRRDPVLGADVTGSDVVYADGAGICLAARLAGRPLPGRLAGIDLMHAILAEAARRRWRPFLLGARPDVLAAAAAHLRRDLPDLMLAGTHHGYFTAGEEGEVVAAINEAGAECLFVALPSPMRERFIARHADRLSPPVLMGVGGSLDVIAGRTPRAPRWMRNSGLEWLFRLWREPGRMGWRYLATNTVFAGLLLRLMLARGTGRAV